MADFDFWHVYRHKRKEQDLFINRFSEKKFIWANWTFWDPK